MKKHIVYILSAQRNLDCAHREPVEQRHTHQPLYFTVCVVAAQNESVHFLHFARRNAI